jgi:hypothetical protein
METIELAIKCVECKSVLDSPVLLPCSDSICKKHVKEGAKEYHCLASDIINPVPNAGFLYNKGLALLVNQKIQKAKFHPEYTSACDAFKSVEKLVDEMKLLQKDPHYIINKAIGELKRETDIIRDEFKLTIDNKADAIIKDLDKYEKECKSNLDSSDVSSKLEKIATNIDGLKDELEKWQETLRCFEPNDDEWKAIREKGDEYSQKLKHELDVYQDDFLMKKLGNYQLKLLSFCNINLESDRK